MDEIQTQIASNTQGFNGFDWAIVGVVLISLLVGAYRGFGREALSLLTWVVAYVLANLFASALGDSLSGVSDNSTVRYMLAWGLIFIGTWAAFSVVARVLSGSMRGPGFNLGNRLLGGAFGLVRGLVIMLAVTLVMKAILPDREQDLFQQAQLMPVLDTMADWLSENFDELRDASPGNFRDSAPVETVEESLESSEMI